MTKSLLQLDILNQNTADFWKRKARAAQNQLLFIAQQLHSQQAYLSRIDELQLKVQSLLSQVTALLMDNQMLLKINHEKGLQIQQLKVRQAAVEGIQQSLSKNNVLKLKRLEDELQTNNLQHRVEIQRLLNQISRLQDHSEEMVRIKQIQVDNQRARLAKQSFDQTLALKKHWHQAQEQLTKNNNQLKLQILNLKSQLMQSASTLAQLSHKNKAQKDRLLNQIQNERRQFQREKQQLQEEHSQRLAQAQRNFAKQLQQTKTGLQKQISNLSEKNANLTKQLRSVQSQRQQEQGSPLLNDQMLQKDIKIQTLKNQLSRQRQQARQQLDNLQQQLTIVADFQLQSNANQQRKLNLCMQAQLSLLKQATQAKDQQILVLQNQLNKLMAFAAAERQSWQSEKIEFVRKIRDMQQQHHRQVQTLKIRLAHLYQADISTLKKSNDMHIANLCQLNGALSLSLKAKNERLIALQQQKINLLRQHSLQTQNHQKEIEQLKIEHTLQKNKISSQQQSRLSLLKTQLLDLSKHNHTLSTQIHFLSDQNINMVQQIKILTQNLQRQQQQKGKLLILQQKTNESHEKALSQFIDNQNDFSLKIQNLFDAQKKKNQYTHPLLPVLQKQLKESRDSIQNETQAKEQLAEELAKTLSEREALRSTLERLVLQHKIQAQNNCKLVQSIKQAGNSAIEQLRQQSSRIAGQYQKSTRQLQKSNRQQKQQLQILVSKLSRRLEEAQLQLQQVKNQRDQISTHSKVLSELEQRVISLGRDKSYIKNITQMFRLRHSE